MIAGLRKNALIAFIAINALLPVACIGVLQQNQSASAQNPWWALLFGGPADTVTPAPIDASTPPVVTLESNPAIAAAMAVEVSSSVATPAVLPGTLVPVGQVYEIGIKAAEFDNLPANATGSVILPATITLTYKYDSAELAEAGFIEEFQVWYFNTTDGMWHPVENVQVDHATSTVTAETNHLTPFVLTALPSAAGTGVAPGPACMDTEFPITGAGGARWTVMDGGFKYYLDRNYFLAFSPELQALGFERALGIATCNGGTPHAGTNPCGLQADHKYSQSASYISFTAPADIDVFVMYDQRLTTLPPWLGAFTDTGVRLPTTDPAGAYLVLRRTYTAGSTVNLEGNWSGLSLAPTPTAQTNYFVAVKPAGNSSAFPPAGLCANPDPADNPPPITTFSAIPGANQVLLEWRNVVSPAITNVIIRRNTLSPPMSPSAGVAPTGIELHPEGYRDFGLAADTDYFYTIFTLSSTGAYSPGRVVLVRTGADADGDNISDAYEQAAANVYPFSGAGTNHLAADTDGDGTDDGVEMANGTDPTNPDATVPGISVFNRLGPANSTMPAIALEIAETDDTAVTGWLLSSDNTPPRPNDLRWESARPAGYEFNTTGSYSLYAFVRDAAGNVSPVAGPVSLNVTSLDFPSYVYVARAAAQSIAIFRHDLRSRSLVSVGSVFTGQDVTTLLAHPNGRFLYALSQNSARVLPYSINASTGALTALPVYTPVSGIQQIIHGAINGQGDALYLLTNRSLVYQLDVVSINPTTGALSAVRNFNTGMNRGPLSVTVHPSGLSVYMNEDEGPFTRLNPSIGTIAQISSTGYSPQEGPRWPVHSSGLFAYTGEYRLTLDPTSGAVQGGVVAPLMPIDFSRDGGFFYNLDSTVTPGQSTVVVSSVNQSTGVLTATGGGRALPQIQWLTDRLIEDSDNALYMLDSVQGLIHTLLRNRQDGSIYSATNSAVSGANSLAAYSTLNTNLPPNVALAQINPLRIYQGGYDDAYVYQDRSFTPLVRIRARSYDRDALRCGANSSNYSRTVQVLDPGGNSVPFVLLKPTTSCGIFSLSCNNSDPNTNPSEFDIQFSRAGRPNGEYRITVALTDDAGSCQGGAATGTTELRLRTARIPNNTPVHLPWLQLPANESSTLRFIAYSATNSGQRQALEHVHLDCRVSGWICAAVGGRFGCLPYSHDWTVSKAIPIGAPPATCGDNGSQAALALSLNSALQANGALFVTTTTQELSRERQWRGVQVTLQFD